MNCRHVGPSCQLFLIKELFEAICSSSVYVRDMMAAGQLVYLTADSPNTLTHLDKESVYIIGGLVDRNAQKGMCLKKANVRETLASRRRRTKTRCVVSTVYAPGRGLEASWSDVSITCW